MKRKPMLYRKIMIQQKEQQRKSTQTRASGISSTREDSISPVVMQPDIAVARLPKTNALRVLHPLRWLLDHLIHIGGFLIMTGLLTAAANSAQGRAFLEPLIEKTTEIFKIIFG